MLPAEASPRVSLPTRGHLEGRKPSMIDVHEVATDRLTEPFVPYEAGASRGLPLFPSGELRPALHDDSLEAREAKASSDGFAGRSHPEARGEEPTRHSRHVRGLLGEVRRHHDIADPVEPLRLRRGQLLVGVVTALDVQPADHHEPATEREQRSWVFLLVGDVVLRRRRPGATASCRRR